MTAHWTDERLLELLERGQVAEGHVTGCAECRRRLDEAAAGLGLAREAEVPEPSPLYWEAFRRQVDQRLEAPAPAWRPKAVASLALAASVLLAVTLLVLQGRREPPPAASAAESIVLPAWSALPDPETDPGWDVLQAMAPGGLQAAVECRLAECLAELSDDESGALVEALRTELGAEGQS